MDSAPAPSPSPPPPTQAVQPAVLAAWPRSAQLALAFVLGSVAALLAVYAYSGSRWASRPAELERGAIPAYRIDLNRADHAELLQLPGVGDSLAGRIESYRRQGGGFRNVDDLGQVRGVGPSTLGRLRPLLTVRAKSEDEPGIPQEPGQSTGKKTAKTVGKKIASAAAPIDVNRAGADELRQLPGIGPALSQRIIDERRKGPFKSVDDLKRVSGIGSKKLEALRPYVTVDGGAARSDATPDRGDDGSEVPDP